MRPPPTTPDHLLQRLVAIFPAFGPYWASDSTFRCADGSFTFCGVFALFTGYFRAAFEQLPVASLRALGEFLGECMAEPHSELDTAAATCFLENLQGEPSAPVLKIFLTGNALHYFEQPEPPQRRRRPTTNEGKQRSPNAEDGTS